ncbi:MAG: tachylectin-related carbohydrate-binding protein [Luteimonas sp.]
MRQTSVRPLWSATRKSSCSRIVLLAAVLVAALPGTVCADEFLKPMGGTGGSSFETHCPANQLLTGFELRTADDVDGIRPLCVTAQGLRDVGAPAAETNWNGGTGAGTAKVVCPTYQPIVIGMSVTSEGAETIVVNSINLYCGIAAETQNDSATPLAFFSAPMYSGGFGQRYSETQHCSAAQVAVGVVGRSGIWLDAIGLICGDPPLSGKAIVHVNPSASSPHPAGWTICDAARAARARNSPVAPKLEAMCAALPAKTIDRVNTGAASPPHPPGWTICDAARAARSRNSPAAPNLERQCAAIKPPSSATGNAATPAYLYTIDGEGKLRWYRHDGAQDGTFRSQGARVVDVNWGDFKDVFPGGDGIIYAITRNGALMRYQHIGFATGLGRDDNGGWLAPQQLANGWGNFAQTFSAGHGVIYAIARDGTLKWYRETVTANGKPSMEGPKDVDKGWNGLKVFSGGDGVIYTIAGDGNLKWTRHNAFMTGAAVGTSGAWESRKDVGTGWNNFERVFSTGNGIVYAVTHDGKLMWYHHKGYQDGRFAWDAPQPVGTGWGGMRWVFAQF